MATNETMSKSSNRLQRAAVTEADDGRGWAYVQQGGRIVGGAGLTRDAAEAEAHEYCEGDLSGYELRECSAAFVRYVATHAGVNVPAGEVRGLLTLAVEEAESAESAPEQITRAEPHRDGSGTVIGLDCYTGGPGSGEVLVGLALPQDARGEDGVEIDGKGYGSPEVAARLHDLVK